MNTLEIICNIFLCVWFIVFVAWLVALVRWNKTYGEWKRCTKQLNDEIDKSINLK